MITKNLKSLSLFLVIMVLMIGAIGAVSAAENAGYSDVKIGTYDDVNVTEVDSGAQGSIDLTIVTSGESSVVQGSTVPDGQNIVAPSGKNIKFDTTLYSDNKGTILVTNAVTASTLTVDAEDGSYSGTITLSATSLAKLTSGETYYVGVVVPAGSSATFKVNEDLELTSTVEEDTTLYVPFTYISKYEIEITEAISKITYGKDYDYKGTVIVNTPAAIPAGSTITATINQDDTTTKTISDIAIKNGNFTLNTTSDINAGKYTVTFTLVDESNNVLATSEAVNLTVEGIKLSLDAVLNETTVAYDNPATLNLTVKDSKGTFKEAAQPTVEITAVNQLTGTPFTIDTITIESDVAEKSIGTGNGPMESSGNPLPVGTYVVTIKSTLANYEIDDVTLTYTVEAAEATIEADPNPLYITGDGPTGNIEVTVVDSDDDPLTFADATEFTVIVRDANGVTQSSEGLIGDLSVSENVLTIPITKSSVKEGYYAVISFTRENYNVESIEVPIYVRSASTLQVNSSTEFTVDYNYGAQNITCVLSLVSGDTKLNGTVNVTNKKGTVLGTVTVVNGAGNLTLSDLNLDAGKYTLTLKYVDANDVYAPATATVKGTIYAIQSYVLSVNQSETTYTLGSDEVIKFTLTSPSNSSKVIDYTGDLTYITNVATDVDDDENSIEHTISMVNGIATIPVSELEALNIANSPITYTFSVNGNNVSNVVTVKVTVDDLDGVIIAENIVAKNDTFVTVEGTVVNASGGSVKIYLIEGKYESLDDIDPATATEIASVITSVNDEGYFVTSFGKLATGNYTAIIEYDPTSADFPADVEEPALISIIVEGESGPEPAPANVSYNTVLVIDDFAETVGAGKSLTGRLLTEDGTPVVGMHIQLTLTRTSTGDSKTYTTTTDYNGEFQFPINLAVGEYTAKATFEGVTIPSTNVTYEASESEETPFYVLPENGTDPNSTNETDVIITPTPYVGTYGSPDYFVVKFTDSEGNPLVGYPIGTIEITLTRLSNGASKTYSYFVTDYKGETQMLIELGAGEYSAHILFTGSTVPAVHGTATADSTITVNA